MRGIRNKKNSGVADEPLINITPLIDVVFVVLIAFIMIAPLLELDRIRLASGDHTPSHIPVRSEVVSQIQIHVHADDSIQFNGSLISLSDLPKKLRQTKIEHPEARAQLFHDKDAKFGTYQKIKNCLEISGFEEMDIVLSPS